MSFVADERGVFNSALQAIAQRKRNLVKVYAESRERILLKIAKYRMDAEAGLKTPEFEEARLASLLQQIDAEVAQTQDVIGTIIKDGFSEISQKTYYAEAYSVEKAINVDIPTGANYSLNFPVLDTGAVDAAFSERIAGHTFLDRMAHDKVVMQYRLRQAVAENIIEGLPVQELKKRLMLIDDVYAQNEAKALMTARTELLRAYSYGQERMAFEAEESGVEFIYYWSSALDGKTRPTHREADRQKAKIINGTPAFSVGGVLFSSPRIVHPSNTSLKTAKEVVNCRCRRINAPDGITPTRRVAVMPDGAWKKVDWNVSAKDWYEHNYGGTLFE